MDYVDKIKKLLALSESNCEAEAAAALIKARELMAKHKIEMCDLKVEKDDKIVCRDLNDITFHSKKDCWLIGIRSTIKQYFPVVVTADKFYGYKTRTPSVSGFEQDVEIVSAIIRYIYDSVHCWAKQYCKVHGIKKGRKMTTVIESFGSGFYCGWVEALEKQKENNQEWGLVLAAPDVSSVLHITGIYSPKASNVDSLELDSFVAYQGMEAGRRYGTTKRLNNRNK